MPRVFSDATGTTPATYGGSVARIDDIGPNGRNAVQSSGALRPSLGRAPAAGVRNLLIRTEELDNAAWSKGASIVVTPDAATAPDGTMTADLINSPGFFQSVSQIRAATSATMVVSVYLRAGSTSVTDWLLLSGGVSLASAGRSIISGPGSIATSGNLVRVSGLTSDWTRVQFHYTGLTVGTAYQVLCYVGRQSSGAEVGNAYIWGAQFESGSTATDYQRVGSPLDVTEAGLASPGFLRFDLSDDVMPVEFPGGFDGDLMIFGRDGSWVQEGITVAPNGTLDIGPRSVPDAPAGLLAALGDVVAWLPVGRTTTAAERSRMRTYYQPFGAAGYLTVGPELITNGDFAADSDWTKGTDWTIGSGVATKTAGTAAGLDQALTLTPGARYLLTFTMTRTAGTLTPQFISGTTVSGTGRSAAGTYAQVLTAVSGNDALRFNGNAAFAGTVDDVSLRELTVGA